MRRKTFLIAEIGINHNGSVSEAKKLIKLAKKYDFDAELPIAKKLRAHIKN